MIRGFPLQRVQEPKIPKSAECPVCLELVRVPYFCKKQHSICKLCYEDLQAKNELNCCPICREGYDEVEKNRINRPLLQMISEMYTLKCIYYENGCEKILPCEDTEVADHENNCAFSLQNDLCENNLCNKLRKEIQIQLKNEKQKNEILTNQLCTVQQQLENVKEENEEKNKEISLLKSQLSKPKTSKLNAEEQRRVNMFDELHFQKLLQQQLQTQQPQQNTFQNQQRQNNQLQTLLQHHFVVQQQQKLVNQDVSYQNLVQKNNKLEKQLLEALEKIKYLGNIQQQEQQQLVQQNSNLDIIQKGQFYLGMESQKEMQMYVPMLQIQENQISKKIEKQNQEEGTLVPREQFESKDKDQNFKKQQLIKTSSNKCKDQFSGESQHSPKVQNDHNQQNRQIQQLTHITQQ